MFNLSVIMKKAHAIARNIRCKKWSLTYREALSQGAKQAWAAARAAIAATPVAESIESRLVAIGGKAWVAGDKNRIYFNNLAELLGLECEFYKTGNVSCALLDGKVISNSKGSNLFRQCRQGKVWFEAGEFHSTGMHEDNAAAIISAIKQRASI
ncbi:MAG: hypothetical protein K2Y10_05730 [Burkholderiaceae bacterium]|nr:hypothetical protein [Burkholderiaceae bacterium]